MSTTNRSLALAITLVLSAFGAAAQTDPCPCIPLSYTWVADACETWNCAASALIMANGDAHVLALPTTADRYKWVVVRRVVTGGAIVSPDAPFVVENFDTMRDGSARYDGLQASQSPILTTMDGGALVIYLRGGTAEPATRPSTR